MNDRKTKTKGKIFFFLTNQHFFLNGVDHSSSFLSWPLVFPQVNGILKHKSNTILKISTINKANSKITNRNEWFGDKFLHSVRINVNDSCRFLISLKERSSHSEQMINSFNIIFLCEYSIFIYFFQTNKKRNNTSATLKRDWIISWIELLATRPTLNNSPMNLTVPRNCFRRIKIW